MPTKYLDNTGLAYYHGKLTDLLDDKADKSQITTLQNNINSEAESRQSADNSLSGRITTLENAGFITKSVNDLTNYYLKTQTYTKTEVDNLISAIATIQIEVVQTLPSTGQSNIIYLVPTSGGGSTGNSYDEYVWVSSSSSFEKIGSTDIDLSNYVQKTQTINGKALSGNITLVASDFTDIYSKTAVDTALGNKVDKVSGKGLSTNDYTTTEKNKLAGIASGAQVNVIETIKKNGTALTITSKAVDISVPTKTSDLTNDSGFITGVASITNAEIDTLFA